MDTLVRSRPIPLVEFLINVLISERGGKKTLWAGFLFFSPVFSLVLLLWLHHCGPSVAMIRICDSSALRGVLINSGLAQFQHILIAAIRRGVDQIAEEARH